MPARIKNGNVRVKKIVKTLILIIYCQGKQEDFEYSDTIDHVDDDSGEVFDYYIADERMAPVTIYKSNQLGISINVEEHEDDVDQPNHESYKPVRRRSTNPFKKLERLASKTKLKCGDDPTESISLVTNSQTNRETLSTTSSMMRGTKRVKLCKKQIYQGRIYMFLEHPTGWIGFTYHMGV